MVLVVLFTFNPICLASAINLEVKVETLDNQDIAINFSIAKIFNPPFRSKLKNGLTNNIMVEIKVTTKKQVLVNKKTLYFIRYDLWDEIFLLKIKTSEGHKRLLVNRVEQLEDFIARQIIILKSTTQFDSPVKIKIKVNKNPNSKDILQKSRRYFENVHSHRQVGGQRSFFGSFVRLFFKDDKDNADNTMNFIAKSIIIVKKQGGRPDGN